MKKQRERAMRPCEKARGAKTYLQGALGELNLGRRDSDLLGLARHGDVGMDAGLAAVDLDALV
jgi:hypothetical protein